MDVESVQKKDAYIISRVVQAFEFKCTIYMESGIPYSENHPPTELGYVIYLKKQSLYHSKTSSDDWTLFRKLYGK